MTSVLRNIVLEISLLFSIPILIPKYDPLLRILSDTMSHKKVAGTPDIPSYYTCRKIISVRLNFRGRSCLNKTFKWRLIVFISFAFRKYSSSLSFHR